MRATRAPGRGGPGAGGRRPRPCVDRIPASHAHPIATAVRPWPRCRSPISRPVRSCRWLRGCASPGMRQGSRALLRLRQPFRNEADSESASCPGASRPFDPLSVRCATTIRPWFRFAPPCGVSPGSGTGCACAVARLPGARSRSRTISTLRSGSDSPSCSRRAFAIPSIGTSRLGAASARRRTPAASASGRVTRARTIAGIGVTPSAAPRRGRWVPAPPAPRRVPSSAGVGPDLRHRAARR